MTGRSRNPIDHSSLQAVDILHGFLGVRCCSEDCAFVVLEDCQPVSDIGGMIITNFRRDAKVGAKECTGEFCNQLLSRIAFIAP